MLRKLISDPQRTKTQNSNHYLNHGRMIEKEWQPINLFKNIRDSAITLILQEEIKKQRNLEYLN